jgi:hypothetical protein
MRTGGFAIVALLAVTLTHSPHATGNTFGGQDALLFANLGQRTVVFRRDILDAQHAVPPSSSSHNCLSEIFHEVDIISYILQEMTVLIGTSGEMINPRDEADVNKTISGEVNYSLHELTNARKIVNLTTGYCATSAIVATKAQETLSLFTEIENALHLIERRV